MNTIEQIVKAKFLATDAQVQALAVVVSNGVTATGIYLGVVLAHVQAALAERKRVTPRVAEACIDEVHKRLYPHVLAGVGPAEMPTDERNIKANYARSAASDLRYFAKAGGDVRTLDPATVKKAALRAEGADVPTGTRVERGIAASLARFERIVQRLAKTSADAARKQIEDAQAKLEALLATLDKPTRHRPRKAAVRVTSTKGLRRTRHTTEQPTAH
jgi:hypothetical protein